MKPIEPGKEPTSWAELFAMSEEFLERETRTIPNVIRLPDLKKKQEAEKPGWVKLAAYRLDNPTCK